MERASLSAPVQGPVKRKRPNSLPRLPRAFYQGDAVVLWTLPTFDRAVGWLNAALHAKFREVMFHAMARERLVCPIYCLMTDHIHLVWMGLSRESDQCNGMAFLRTHLEPELAPAKFQPQAHDHVLREEERKRNAFARVCHYVAENPVRAGLVQQREQSAYVNCLVPGYPKLSPFEKAYWAKFWKVYYALKGEDAGMIRKPRT